MAKYSGGWAGKIFMDAQPDNLTNEGRSVKPLRVYQEYFGILTCRSHVITRVDPRLPVYLSRFVFIIHVRRSEVYRVLVDVICDGRVHHTNLVIQTRHPSGGFRMLERLCQLTILPNVCRKLYENERKWTERGNLYSLDPPMDSHKKSSLVVLQY